MSIYGPDISGLLRLLGCALFIIAVLIVALVWSLMR